MNYMPEKDFLVFDHTEEITWRRPQSGRSETISEALRLSRLACLRSDSAAEKDEVQWLFQKSALNGMPLIPGDRLVDSAGVCWSVFEVQDLHSSGCWKCVAVNPMARWDLTDLLDLYRPVWEVDENGFPFPKYDLSRPGIPAKLIPGKNEKEMEIHFAEPSLKLRYRDCFVTADNRAFRVLEFQPAATLRELSKALATVVTL